MIKIDPLSLLSPLQKSFVLSWYYNVFGLCLSTTATVLYCCSNQITLLTGSFYIYLPVTALHSNSHFLPSKLYITSLSSTSLAHFLPHPLSCSPTSSFLSLLAFCFCSWVTGKVEHLLLYFPGRKKAIEKKKVSFRPRQWERLLCWLWSVLFSRFNHYYRVAYGTLLQFPHRGSAVTQLPWGGFVGRIYMLKEWLKKPMPAIEAG